MRSCSTRAMGNLAERYGAGQRIARQSTPNDFWWSPGGCARWWNRTPAGKPIASLLRLPRSKRVFQKSMIRNRARGSSGRSYGSPTLWFAWRSFTWSRRLGQLLPRIVRRPAFERAVDLRRDLTEQRDVDPLQVLAPLARLLDMAAGRNRSHAQATLRAKRREQSDAGLRPECASSGRSASFSAHAPRLSSDILPEREFREIAGRLRWTVFQNSAWLAQIQIDCT
jgi:hypothetical protein